jgi:hypothetical protein
VAEAIMAPLSIVIRPPHTGVTRTASKVATSNIKIKRFSRFDIEIKFPTISHHTLSPRPLDPEMGLKTI